MKKTGRIVFILLILSSLAFSTGGCSKSSDDAAESGFFPRLGL